MMIRIISSLLLLSLGCFFVSCQTARHEARREQELERIKQEVSGVRGDRADMETMAEELKVEISRLRGSVDDHAQAQRQHYDEVKKELAALSTRIQAIEQREVDQAEQQTAAVIKEATLPKGYDAAKRLFDEGKFADAIDALNGTPRTKMKGEELKKTQFLLAESSFMAKDYATAALEFAEYKKNFPKDKQTPQAVYRLANAFKNLGKNKEAKLFYQELIEKFPKSPQATKAKLEMRKLK